MFGEWKSVLYRSHNYVRVIGEAAYEGRYNTQTGEVQVRPDGSGNGDEWKRIGTKGGPCNNEHAFAIMVEWRRCRSDLAERADV